MNRRGVTQSEIWKGSKVRSFCLWSWGVPPSRHADVFKTWKCSQAFTFRIFMEASHLHGWLLAQFQPVSLYWRMGDEPSSFFHLATKVSLGSMSHIMKNKCILFKGEEVVMKWSFDVPQGMLCPLGYAERQ